MKFVIVGCGRVGSTLAESLDQGGHEVVIFDLKTSAFDRLPDDFKGLAIRGDGTDEEVLRNGGCEGADIFLSLTEGDNRNIMAAQLAAESLGIPRVIAKINDPVRADAYADLGLATLCRTNLMVESISDFLDLGMNPGAGIKGPSETGSHVHPHEPSSFISQTPGVRSIARTGSTGRADGAEPDRRGGESDRRAAEPEPEPGRPSERTDARPAGSRGFFRRGRE